MQENSKDRSGAFSQHELSEQTRAADEFGLEVGEWAAELLRWYEAEWVLAKSNGRPPDKNRVMEVLDPSRRPMVKSLFESIDSRYTSQEKFGADSGGGHPPEIGSAAGDTKKDVDHQATDVSENAEAMLEPTIALGDDSTGRDGSEPKGSEDAATLDFSEGPRQRSYKITSHSKRPKSTDAKLPTIPQYEIHQVLGRGGMGVVYLATQSNIGRLVALKMVLAAGHASQRLLDRFQAEARAVGQLQHENIVRIFESGFHDDLPYFSLEFIDGPSLSETIGGEPMDPREAAKLLLPVAKGLDYAHGKGIIHRDIKPANILLTADRVPKISDFGLAKQLESEEELSRTGEIMGTPSFMAPEQAQGEREIGAAADIYSLGAVLYCALTGRPPFQSSKPTDTLVQVIQQEPVVPTRLQPNIDRDLETICLKCLQKNPVERYSTSADLAADLERYLNGEPIKARPVGRLERAWRWSRRNQRMAGLMATAAMLALVLAIGGPILAGIIYGQKKEVDGAIVIAKEKTQEALQAQIAAEENEKKAEANAEAAATQEKNAIDTLKSVVFEVQRTMKGQPSIQPLRLAIIEIAREGLSRMEAAGSDYQAQDIIAAGLYRRMGELNLELGLVQPALENFQTCLEALVRVSERGELPGRRHNLSNAYDNLGEAYRRSGKLIESSQYYAQSIDERRHWVQEEPENEFIGQNLAAALGKAGTLAIAQGDMQAARRLLQESFELRNEFFQTHPESELARTEWIGARWALSLLSFQEGDAEKGREEITEVVNETERLIPSLAQPFAMKLNLCRFRLNLGDMYLYGGELEQAANAYQTGINECRKLVEQDREYSAASSTLGDLLYRLGVVLRLQEEADAGTKSLRECLSIRKPLYEGEPDNLAKQIGVLVVLARLGELKELTSILEDAEKAIKTDAGMLYELAGVYSLIAESLAGGAEPPTADWTVTAAEELSLQAIKKATASGFRRTMDLQQDPDFSQVRKTKGYQEVLEATRE